MKKVRINSKLVEPGDIFVAITCPEMEKYIEEAFNNGASIVFAENSKDNRVIKVDNARMIASKLAKFTYDKQPNNCVAITGTNGKSSTCHFLSQIWSYLGYKSANLGTLGLFINGEKANPSEISIPNLTTPDAITLHQIANYLFENEITHFTFEASSHALDQNRLASMEIKAAGFTNLASDHMDYHKTPKDYLEAKMKLFREILPNDKPVVISKDYPEIYDEMLKVNNNTISFGLNDNNDLRVKNVKELADHIVFDLIYQDRCFKEVELKLFGQFQIMNVLCATGLALACGENIDDIIKTLPRLKALNGRMEHIRSLNGGDIYIDYAHTSKGFKSALECFRKVCKGRLICVFGCGGDRDKSKRAEMGEIAKELADIVIVTDDNPRTESPDSIRSEIIQHCPNAINIGNRKDAIHKAISMIGQGDFVVIIGKGHEEYQIYKDKTIHFSDREAILAY